ncbi:HATPase_UhpB-NarQ-NarX-like domain containing protein [Microbacteriaceae bacterium]
MPKGSSGSRISKYFGPGAFDPAIALPIIFASAIAQILLGPEFTDIETTYKLYAVFFVSHTAVLLTFLLFGKLLKPGLASGRIKFYWVIVIGLFLGVERAAAGWVTSQATGISPNLQFFSPDRLVSGIISCAILIFLITILGTARQKFTQTRENLLAINVIQKSDLGVIPDEVRQFVDATRTTISQLPKETNWADIKKIIHQIISNDLRPMSHKLWELEDKKLQSFSLKSIFLRASNDHFYRPHLVVPIWFLTTLPLYVSDFGLATGLEMGLIRAALLLGVLLVASQIKTSSPSLQIAKLVITVFVFDFLQIVVGRSLLDFEDQTIELRNILAALLWITELIIMVGMSWALFESGANVKAQLDQVDREGGLQHSPAAGAEMLRSRKLARHLHGQVHNRLLALIGVEEPREKAHKEDLLSSIDLVLQSALEPYDVPITSAKELEDSILTQWSGLVDLNLEFLPKELMLTQDSWSLVSGVVEEGIANAVRHGFASSVKISVVYTDSELIVSIRDDGTGPRQGPPGIGSAFFSAISNDWVLKETGSGSKLRIVLPIS